jgi:RelE toxin of RelE / RelB toxin-antitoxin system
MTREAHADGRRQKRTDNTGTRFQRFARKEGIADAALRGAVARAEKGQIDADLGGEVIKQRIARPGQGRSKIVLSLTEKALAARLKEGDFVEAKSE